MGVVRTLVTSTLVGATSSARAGIGVAQLTVSRTPSLVALSARATISRGPDAARAEAVFRDELLTLLDEVAEVTWRQARRARFELGERTAPDHLRPSANGRAAAAAGGNGAPHRRHRVKT